MGKPGYLCSVFFACAPVLGLCFFVSVDTGKKGALGISSQSRYGFLEGSGTVP